MEPFIIDASDAIGQLAVSCNTSHHKSIEVWVFLIGVLEMKPTKIVKLTRRRLATSVPIFLLACTGFCQPASVSAESVAVRYTEGVSRGFLIVRTQDGKQIAEGDSSQVATGDRVTSRMTFRFKDGSIEDETTVFSQHGAFRLLSDHFLQKGPAFKRAIETSIDAITGQVVIRYTEGGKENILTQRIDLPSDLSNGLLLTLLKNIQSTTPRTTVSYLAATPKPRIVQLVISPLGDQAFSTGSSKHKAINYDVKVEIGGAAGALAHLVGKQPSDTHVWVLPGEAPTLAALESSFYEGGPIWRVEPVSPTLHGQAALLSKK
jgi:hypothetical protein